MRFVLFAAVAMLSACTKAPCEDPETAFTKAQGLIRGFLKAPATATFPKFGTGGVFASPTKTEDGKCAFMVVTYVDSENGFGAKVRSEFSAVVTPADEGAWSLVSLTDLTGKGMPGTSR